VPPSRSIVVPLLESLAQTGCIILLGYLSVSVNLVGRAELKGIYKFCGKIALPAIFFSEVANIEWGSIHVSILLGMFAAKVVTFLVVAAYVLARQRWQPRAKGGGYAKGLLSTMGMFCIFATKSNDIALGVPLINAVFGAQKFSTYLYLFAPFQLLILNVAGFIMLELDRSRKNEAESEGGGGSNTTQPATTVATSLTSSDSSSSILSEDSIGPNDTAATRANTVPTGRTASATGLSGNTGIPAATTVGGNPSPRSVTYKPERTLTVPLHPANSPPHPKRLSTCALLPRVLWNVITTPPVLSVILGLITNVVLTFTLSDATKASRDTLLPTPVESGLTIISNGYAVTALFSIGAGMYGCLGRATFSRSDIFDGVVLIVFKVLYIAYATNRCVSLLMGLDPNISDQLLSDAADFGWLYGMTPVAPTIYMFAELYGVHQDFMALFSNLCMVAAAPLMIMAVITLDTTKHMDERGVMHLHDVLAGFLALVGVCATIPLLLGFVCGRLYRWCPCDYIMVMLVAYVGYSAQTLSCIAQGHDATSVFPALLAFFFETLYQSHMAALSLFLGFKHAFARTKSRRRFQAATHVLSLAFAGTLTAIVYATQHETMRASSEMHCAIEMMNSGKMASPLIGVAHLLCLVGGSYGMLRFYRRRAERSSKERQRRQRRDRQIKAPPARSPVDIASPLLMENGVDCVDDFSSPFSTSSDRSVSTYGLYPPPYALSSQQTSAVSMDSLSRQNASLEEQTPERVVVLICFAMLCCLCRAVTSFTFNFDIPSTIEISLLSVVVTFSQGLVLFMLYALHPRTLRYLTNVFDWVVWCSQPTDEISELVARASDIMEAQEVTSGAGVDATASGHTADELAHTIQFDLDCDTNYESKAQLLSVIDEKIALEEGGDGDLVSESKIQSHSLLQSRGGGWIADRSSSVMIARVMASLDAPQREAWSQRNRRQLLTFRTRSTAGPF
jgi:predicted permease